MSATARSSARVAHDDQPSGERSPDAQRGLALGYLALLPLLAAYEFGAHASGTRNLAEVLLCLPLAGLGARLDDARRLLLVLLALVAVWRCFHAHLGLAARVWRIVLEGTLCAILLGPALLAVFALLGAQPPALEAPLASAPASIARAALLCGGAVYEELVFRVGLQSLFFLLLRALIGYQIASEGLAHGLSEVLALCLSALCFAAMHLALFTQLVGPGGERFDGAIFTWRLLAGILLGALFRWRGPGVTGWAHALFNLGLFIGAGPDVFL